MAAILHMRGASINSVVLSGEVVSDAAFAYTPRGTGVTTFTLAFFSELPDGGRKKGTIDIVCIGDAATGCAGIVKRSAMVKLKGRLQQRSWKTPEGFYKNKTEIVAHSVELLGSCTTADTG